MLAAFNFLHLLTCCIVMKQLDLKPHEILNLCRKRHEKKHRYLDYLKEQSHEIFFLAISLRWFMFQLTEQNFC
jgi:hypothetical protein